MVGNDFIWRFTPSRTEPRVLEEIFVQRQEMLANIVERVRESALTGNKHQILLVGPRGIGKTHLIALLHHRITQDSKLSKKVRIAWLLEDETVTSFVQLLKRVYELLVDEYPAEFPQSWLEDILDHTPARIVKALEAALVDKFRDKTLLLFIENLDLIFECLGDEGQKQLRAFLQAHAFTTIVATSQRLCKSVKAREQPFFGFFATENLRPLPAPDAVDLLRRIAQNREQADLVSFLVTPEGRSRVRALHHLAGGNHRIYVVLSGFITRESLDELAGPFEKMADELTPYYQERMRWLTPQQRQIVEYLCSREDTCTPKEIARHLLTTENTVSSQLKKLLELGYVLRSPRGRETLYELAEPLMRLASEVKERRRKPLRLLVDFLRIWYRPDVLPHLLENAGTPSLRDYLQAAISRSRSSPDPRLRLLERDIASAKEENRLDDLVQVLEERAHTRGSAPDWHDLASCYANLNNFESAIECYDKALKVDPRNVLVWSHKGFALSSLGRNEAAIGCYDKAIEIDPRYTFAWCLKGAALGDLGRHQAAIDSYDKALEIDPRYPFAWYIKGLTLKKLDRLEAAIDCFDTAVEINPQDKIAWNDKGNALDKLGRYEAAVDCFDRALKIDPGYIYARINKGLTLRRLGKDEAARECFDRAQELESSDRERLFRSCESTFALRQWNAGFALLREAFDRYPRDTTHDVETILDLILKLREGQEKLRGLLAKLIAIYHEASALSSLGDGLVRSLRGVDRSRLGSATLADWRSAWLELGADHAELEIPLRIFRVGMDYLIHGDEKFLLDLVTVERKILRQALGLDEADDVE